MAQQNNTGLYLLLAAGAAVGFWYLNSCQGVLADTIALPSFPLCGGGGGGTSTTPTGPTTPTTPTSSSLRIPVQNLGTATVGRPYSYTWQATGGVPPYTWSATGLPPGLTMSSDGVMSGTPTQLGTVTMTVLVTDSTGATAGRRTQWGVRAPPMPV